MRLSRDRLCNGEMTSSPHHSPPTVSNIHLVIPGIIQERGGTTMGSSSNELPSARQWVYPWEKVHHTRTCAHNHMKAQLCRRNFRACLPLGSSRARAACVLLNPILKECFTPHVWEALGIGREHTHVHTMAHTQTRSTCLMQCSVTRANRHIRKTRTSIPVTLFLFMKKGSCRSSSWPVHFIQQWRGRFYVWVAELLNYCFSIASFILYFLFSYCILVERGMTAGALTLKVHVNLWVWERKEEDQRDRGMVG